MSDEQESIFFEDIPEMIQGGEVILDSPPKNTKKQKCGNPCRNWCFTSFATNTRKWMDSDDIKYIGYEVEKCPETGREHLQGFFQLKEKKRITWIKKNLSPEIHLSNMRGTFEENVTYCSKDGNFTQRGEFTKKGERKDLNEVFEQIMEGTYEPGPEYIQYHSGIDKLQRKCAKDRAAKEFKDDFNAAHICLNDAQSKWLDHIEHQNDREVTWVYDPKGNSGKSYFADYLLVNANAVLLTNAPTRDIAMAYNSERVVVFDYSRDQESRINYGVIEQLKNGRIFSSKYESTTKLFKKPKIICFSNFHPDVSKLSEDRWDIIKINCEDKEDYEGLYA